VLTLGFPESDQERISDLATRNQQGSLTADEREELEKLRPLRTSAGPPAFQGQKIAEAAAGIVSSAWKLR